MSDRIPGSSGLPLRAMVMVLLFLGVIFALLGLQAMRSGGNGDSTPVVAPVTTTTPSPEPVKVDVRVYNISDVEGAAGRTADTLRQAGWNVTDVGSLTLDGVSKTTVFFREDAPDERKAADEVGKLLDAPVESRIPPLAEQPPGVIVVVTG